MLFKFLSNFKVFGKLVNKLSSILSSSNLQIGEKRKTHQKIYCKLLRKADDVAKWRGETDASLKVKMFS